MKKILAQADKKELGVLFIACIIYAISLVLLVPVPLIPGSFLGIAVALNKTIGSSVGLVNFLLNLPVLLLCLRIFHPKVFTYSVLVIVMTSAMIDGLTPFLPQSVYSWYPWMIVVAGGILMGVGAGLILEMGATMAGTTALSRVIQKWVPGLTVGTLIMVMDVLIVLLGAVIIKSWMALPYSVLYTVCYSVVIDLVHKSCVILKNKR